MALYRKYRPASFAEVVGQEHVTEPLSVALDSGRINHAYLFSGPRGCGKTSSARILARSLNCAEGPTSTPCGKCDSCIALAPGGPGSLDVTELDAASHRGVDDMRELRDRAFYAPADSRYRVFIIDEAHMITTEGFNTLLKIVEEPPEHLIFIFATTEPEKLLATIRSRTHNYPFRLLTPPDMRGLLERIVAEEGVTVEDSVYPLVVRAGGGSPRDSLSILDQLLAGAGPEGVTYKRAVALLGVTDSSLLDRSADALAAQDQAGLFSVVDDVINAGYDPRRFAMDLLDRFRDLLVVQAVPDAFERGLVDVPEQEQEVLKRQAEALGPATLTRCAAVVNDGLSQMRGATSPRLLLEILCARMALPAAGMTVEALAQRVEALEQGTGVRAAGPMGASGGLASPTVGAGASPTGDAQGLSSGKRYERPRRRQAAAASQAAQEAQQAEQRGAAQAQQAQDAQQSTGSEAAQQGEGQHSAGKQSAGQQSAGQENPAQQAQQGQTDTNAASTADAQSQGSGQPEPQEQVREQGSEQRSELQQAQPDQAGASQQAGARPAGAPDTGAQGQAQQAAAQPSQADQDQEEDEDPVIAQAREAREIMDRHRAAARARAGQTQQGAGAQRAQAQGSPQQGAAQQQAQGASSQPENVRPQEVAPQEPSQQKPDQQDAAPQETTPQAAAPQAWESAAAEVDDAAWQKILGKVKEHDLSAWIAGRDATLAKEQPTDGQIVVEHSTGALAKFVNSDRNAPIYSKAAEEVLGSPHTVLATVGGANPGKAQAGSAEATGESAPQQQQTSEHQGSAQPTAGQATTQPSGAQVSNTQGGGTAPVAGNAPAQNVATHAAQGSEPNPASQSAQQPGSSSAPQAAPHAAPRAESSAGSSALERARRMAEANAAQAAAPAPQHTQPHPAEDSKPQTGWRARAAKYAASREYKFANGFNGVPLPDEPPEDPWDSGPGPGPNAGGANAGPNAGPAPAGQGPGGGAPQGGQPGGPHQAGPNNNRMPNQALGTGVPNQGQQPADPEEDLRRQQDELMDDLASGQAGQRETRPAIEIAGELIENILGGERTR